MKTGKVIPSFHAIWKQIRGWNKPRTDISVGGRIYNIQSHDFGGSGNGLRPDDPSDLLIRLGDGSLSESTFSEAFEKSFNFSTSESLER